MNSKILLSLLLISIVCIIPALCKPRNNYENKRQQRRSRDDSSSDESGSDESDERKNKKRTYSPSPPGQQAYYPQPPGQAYYPQPPGQAYYPQPPGQAYYPPPPGQGYYAPPPPQQGYYAPPPPQQAYYAPPSGQQGYYVPPSGQQGYYAPPPCGVPAQFQPATGQWINPCAVNPPPCYSTSPNNICPHSVAPVMPVPPPTQSPSCNRGQPCTATEMPQPEPGQFQMKPNK